jgi:putative nucleotidyltransferase with HDIG domain
VSGRVLIVDDDASFAEMVSEILREKGWEPVCFTEPARALAQLGETEVLAAVVDLVMPGMDGLELADQIRRKSPETPVLILTGQGDMDAAIDGLHHGVSDFLRKADLSAAHLDRAIRSAVEKARLSRENRALLDRLAESNRLLRALNEVSALVVAEAHFDRILLSLVSAAKEIFGAEAGRALLLERSGEGIVVKASAGDGRQPTVGIRLRDEGLATLCWERNEPLVLARPVDHPRYSERCDALPTALPGLVCVPLRHGTPFGTLLVGGRKRPFTGEDRDLLASLGQQAAVAMDNALAQERNLNFFTHISELLVSVLETLDVFYPGHSRATAALSDMVTRRLGMAEGERRNVHFAALLHDIGKIRLDPAILKTEGRMTDEAWRLMREHPALGLEILKPITLWEDVLPIIHAHHERWDGKGYPRGLAGEEIPLGARVVGVAEAFDAMTRNTPHGARRTPEQALGELEAFAGTQFDPRIVRLFVAEYRARGHQIKD